MTDKTEVPNQDENLAGEPIGLRQSRFLSQAQIDALNQPVPKASLKTRQGAGNSKFAYVDPLYVTAQLNRIFGFDGWSEETTSCEVKDSRNVSIKGYTWENNVRKPAEDLPGFCLTATAIVRLTIHLFDDQGNVHKIVRDGVGSAASAEQDKEGQSYGDLYERTVKSAASDGLKRAAKTLGKVFGLNIREDKQIDEIAVESDTAQPPAVEPAKAAPKAEPPKPAAKPAAPAPAPKPAAAPAKPAAEPAKPAETPTPAEPPKPAEAAADVPAAAASETSAPGAVEEDVADEQAIDPRDSEGVYATTKEQFEQMESSQWQKHSTAMMAEIIAVKEIGDLRRIVPIFQRMQGPVSKVSNYVNWHNLLVKRSTDRLAAFPASPEVDALRTQLEGLKATVQQG